MLEHHPSFFVPETDGLKRHTEDLEKTPRWMEHSVSVMHYALNGQSKLTSIPARGSLPMTSLRVTALSFGEAFLVRWIFPFF